MDSKNIIWSSAVKEKLLEYRSEHFTSKETLKFITKLMLDIEELFKK